MDRQRPLDPTTDEGAGRILLLGGESRLELPEITPPPPPPPALASSKPTANVGQRGYLRVIYALLLTRTKVPGMY